MTTGLREFFDLVAANAADTFLDRGVLVPMWHAVDADGRDHIKVTPWRDADNKRAVVERMRQLFRDERIVRYAVMSESWFVEGPDAKFDGYSGRIARHPDRREILSITAEDRVDSILGWRFILRPEHGPPKLSPLKTLDGAAIQGRMAGLLR